MSRNNKVRQQPDAFNNFISGIIKELMQEEDFRNQAKQAVGKIILDLITPEKVLTTSGGAFTKDPQLLSIAKPENTSWSGRTLFVPNRPDGNDREVLFGGIDALSSRPSDEKLFNIKRHWKLDEIMWVYHKYLQNEMEAQIFSFQDISSIVPDHIDAIVSVSVVDRKDDPRSEEAALVCSVKSSVLSNENGLIPFHEFSYKLPLFRCADENFSVVRYIEKPDNAFETFLLRLSRNCLINHKEASVSRPLQLFRIDTKEEEE